MCFSLHQSPEANNQVLSSSSAFSGLSSKYLHLRSLIRSKRKIYWGTSGSSVLFRTNPNSSDTTKFTSFSLSETDPSLLLIHSTTNWGREQTWLRFGMISRRMTRSFPLQMKYLPSIPPPQTSNKADS
jgi:hypothetical protein